MSSRLRQPSEQELRDLAMTLAGELDPSKSRYDDPQTRIEAANILATVVNRFSTDDPRRFGESDVRQYTDYSDVVRNPSQYNAWSGSSINRTQANYGQRQEYFDGIVRDFFSGELQATYPAATHYHADHVSPGWSRNLDRVGGTLGATGPHIFYNDEAWMQMPLGEHRPSYAMAEFTPQPQQPNPASDFNRQELAHIAPSVPATATQMAAARAARAPGLAGAPIQQRTIGGYAPEPQSVTEMLQGMVAPGAAQHISDRLPGLTDQTQQRLAQVVSYLPQEARDGFMLTSTIRPGHPTHGTGTAVDIRNRDSTPFQEAQHVAALAKAGFEAIGPYATGSLGVDRRGRPSPPHIHVGQDTRYNAPGSVFQMRARGDNPYLSGTQPNSGLYDAVDFGSPVSDAWFGWTPPNPTADAQPKRMGDGSLDESPRREETTPRLSETYAGVASAARRAAPQTFNARPSYPSGLPPARSTGVPANAPQSTFPARPSMGTGGLPASVPRLDAMRAQSDQIIRDTERAPSGPFSISGPPASAPRKSPDQFQYQTRTRQVPNPAYRAPSAPSSPNQATPLTSYFSGMSGADYRSPAPTAPREPEFIPERYQVQVPVPGPVRPQGPQFGNVPNPMARPHGLPRSPGPQVPRRRVGLVPNPIVPPNVPRRQGFGGQGFVGLGDWAQGFMAPRVADSVSHTMRRASRVQQAGPPMQLAPPQLQPAQANQGGFIQGLLSTQPTNPSLNGRAQGPWNSRGGEGGFVW